MAETRARRAQPARTTPTPDRPPRLSIIPRDDGDRLTALAKRIGDTPSLWDDRMLADPALAVSHIIAHPAGITFDIADGGGFLSITSVIRNWRATAYIALWSRAAVIESYRHAALHTALTAAFDGIGLLAIDAFIDVRNIRSINITEAMGFKRRGILPDHSIHAGETADVVWYEMHRDDLPAARARLTSRLRSRPPEATDGQGPSPESQPPDRRGLRVPTAVAE